MAGSDVNQRGASRVFASRLLATCLVLIACRARPPAAEAQRCTLVGTGSQCNTLAPAGGSVEIMRLRGAAPAAKGGELPSGSYVLVGRQTYSATGKEGPTGEFDDFTLELSGVGPERRMELVQRQKDCPVSRESLKVRIEGTTIDSDLTCPPCSIQTCRGRQTYSWDGTTLTVMRAVGADTTALIFKWVSPSVDGGVSR